MGSLPMGAKLSETVLAERLNATKAPVRDAIKRLKSEGLVTIKPKSGTFVFSLSRSELNDFLEFRYCIEVDAMRLSYQRNKGSFIQEMRAILDHMEYCISNNNSTEYLSLDSKYHQLLIKYSNNTYHREAYNLVASRMATIRTHMGCNREHMLRSFTQHQEICTALSNDKLHQACDLLLSHTSPKHGAYWEADNLGL